MARCVFHLLSLRFLLEQPFSYRVNRGGSWGDDAVYSRVAYRRYDTPGNWSINLGFRPVFGSNRR
jgi:hypothetical protein